MWEIFILYKMYKMYWLLVIIQEAYKKFIFLRYWPWLYDIPHFKKVENGVFWFRLVHPSFCLCVCLSVCLSVDGILSDLYLAQIHFIFTHLIDQVQKVLMCSFFLILGLKFLPNVFSLWLSTSCYILYVTYDLDLWSHTWPWNLIYFSPCYSVVSLI